MSFGAKQIVPDQCRSRERRDEVGKKHVGWTAAKLCGMGGDITIAERQPADRTDGAQPCPIEGAEALEIEAAGRFDFMYVPTVSRPSEHAAVDKRIGQGRASNVLRHIFDLPTTEEENQTSAGGDVARTAANIALERLVHPVLPSHLSPTAIRDRVDPAASVLLTCGNPVSTADIRSTAARRQIRFEMEEW